MKKIGILCAGDAELEPFLPHIENGTVIRKAMLNCYDGEICGVPVTALYSGVCKVNAAIAAQVLIDFFQVGAIINAGTAGGMDERLQVIDTVISTQAGYHDVAKEILTEFHPWMPQPYFPADSGLLELARKAVRGKKGIYFGTMVTGEPFIEGDLRHEIQKKHMPLSVDMETASVAHVCYVNHVPFLAIRTVTDTAAQPGEETFEKNCMQASVRSKEITLDLLREIRQTDRQ